MDPSLNLLAYANDHAIIKELHLNQATEERNTINLLMENLNYIKEWMNLVRLKMNNSKSEFIIFGNKTQVDKCIFRWVENRGWYSQQIPNCEIPGGMVG